MITEKEQVIEMIRRLPANSTVDDILEELYFRIQINHGIKELDDGKGIEHQDVFRRQAAPCKPHP